MRYSKLGLVVGSLSELLLFWPWQRLQVNVREAGSEPLMDLTMRWKPIVFSFLELFGSLPKSSVLPVGILIGCLTFDCIARFASRRTFSLKSLMLLLLLIGVAFGSICNALRKCKRDKEYFSHVQTTGNVSGLFVASCPVTGFSIFDQWFHEYFGRLRALECDASCLIRSEAIEGVQILRVRECRNLSDLKPIESMSSLCGLDLRYLDDIALNGRNSEHLKIQFPSRLFALDARGSVIPFAIFIPSGSLEQIDVRDRNLSASDHRWLDSLRGVIVLKDTDE